MFPKVARAAVTALVFASASACSEPAAPAEAICWPGGGTPTAGAEVEIGTGQASFEPLVEDQPLVLVRGTQGGFHFLVHAKMRGMTPGNPGDPRAGNPNTFFQAFTLDGDNVTSRECEFPFGYREDDDGGFVLPSSRLLLVRRDLGDSLFGQRVRVQAEMLDPDGRYAIDSRIVTVIEEPDLDAGPLDAGPTDAGPTDAGPTDAGPTDAGT